MYHVGNIPSDPKDIPFFLRSELLRIAREFGSLQADGWRDMIGTIIVQDVGSATAPAWATYTGNLKAYQFATGGSATREVFLVFHVDHDYAPGTDIHIHTHWSCIAAHTGDVKWYFDVSYAKGHNQAAFSTPVTTSVTQTSSGVAFQHMIAEVQLSAASPSASQIDTDLLEPDGLLLVRCYRNRDDVADTLSVGPFLHFVDIHYQSDRSSTLNKAPDFYR